MNYKNLLIASLVFANFLGISAAYSQELQAKVAKGAAVNKKYASIDKLIEYNNYDEADTALREVLNAHPDDVDAQTLRVIWMAKQHKLAPAQAELDKMLKNTRKSRFTLRPGYCLYETPDVFRC